MATIGYLTTAQFDFGAIGMVSAECKRLGIGRPLIVTDAGIRASGLLDRLKESLDASLGFEVFDGTPPNPTEAATLAALERDGRRFIAGSRQGCRAAGDASRSARAVRRRGRRCRKDHGSGGAAHRHSDDGRYGQ
jgi:hypothetical protein